YPDASGRPGADHPAFDHTCGRDRRPARMGSNQGCARVGSRHWPGRHLRFPLIVVTTVSFPLTPSADPRYALLNGSDLPSGHAHPGSPRLPAKPCFVPDVEQVPLYVNVRHGLALPGWTTEGGCLHMVPPSMNPEASI